MDMPTLSIKEAEIADVLHTAFTGKEDFAVDKFGMMAKALILKYPQLED